MSLSNSLSLLEQTFNELRKNTEQLIGALQQAVETVIQTALKDDKTPLRSALALRQALESAGYENSFDVVIFGDLNRFKGLNDRFGHTAGDFAIQYVGNLIQELLVEQLEAQAFRQGGDEFVVLLRREFLERFQNSTGEFAECRFEFENEQIKTAMSFGFAVRDEEADFEDLLTRAEAACQEAKRLGDGISVQWSKELESAAFVSRRERCAKCRTEIKCNIPNQNQLLSLAVCPVCQFSLISEESLK